MTAIPSSPAGEWRPSVTLDVLTAGQKAFDDTWKEFYRINADQVPLPGLLDTGWHTVTPEIAEQLLFGKANRRLSIAHIAYLARQMMDGAWKLTGQSIIITKDGVMRDAYHRVWASYLSNTPFTTYVVTDVEPVEQMFAYIDNSKVRSNADALASAGLNGLSTLLAAVTKIAVRFERGYYTPNSRVRIERMTPVEVQDFVQARPTLSEAAHQVVAEHKQVLSLLLNSKKDVACFVAWQILDLYDEDVMEDFFIELADENTVGPIGLLRAKLMAEVDRMSRGYRPTLKTRDVLAFMIKAFNAWQTGAAMRRLILGTDEAFPDFVGPSQAAPASDEVVYHLPPPASVQPEA